MKRMLSLLVFGVLMTSAVANAQVPRTVLAELGAATW